MYVLIVFISFTLIMQSVHVVFIVCVCALCIHCLFYVLRIFHLSVKETLAL